MEAVTVWLLTSAGRKEGQRSSALVGVITRRTRLEDLLIMALTLLLLTTTTTTTTTLSIFSYMALTLRE
eukprot:scaffold43020_cov45-Phaeocystis_antarctica.AAC.1